ncbi:MAG: NAD(P)-dependent oxidoreductase [Polaromonas sp.]|nr:NAD(P)-dependent oxidoreductase [Polaromonas sp.]
MKVLVLGASGHIGNRLMQVLNALPGTFAVGASRRARSGPAGGGHTIRLDARNEQALANALQQVDAVVNCVAGDSRSIAEGARALASAAQAAKCRRVVHLSTMSVYGSAEGCVPETAPMRTDLGWYGRAKCEAEAHMAAFAASGGHAVVLRPGCVFGPGSELWAGRIGRWLWSGRLGDLGAGGDGWSNLVHVNDVCAAIVAALRAPACAGGLSAFNLAGPDSPRWNDYFVDLALALGATPVRRFGARRVLVDAWLAGPPLKIAQRALQPVGRACLVPDPLPPRLLGLWQQHIRLNTTRATHQLGIRWTPYDQGLVDSAAWYREQA